VAVPAGDYRVACSFDLSPLLGKVEGDFAVRIETPPPDLLERYLASLSSPDAGARREAVRELAWFGRDADRVVPALLAFHERASKDERVQALWSLMGESFREEMAKHPEAMLRVIEAREDRVPGEIDAAAFILAETAPWDERVERALAALPPGEGITVDGVRRELHRYRSRHAR
jgi:hypothetical protein